MSSAFLSSAKLDIPNETWPTVPAVRRYLSNLGRDTFPLSSTIIPRASTGTACLPSARPLCSFPAILQLPSNQPSRFTARRCALRICVTTRCIFQARPTSNQKRPPRLSFPPFLPRLEALHEYPESAILPGIAVYITEGQKTSRYITFSHPPHPTRCPNTATQACCHLPTSWQFVVFRAECRLPREPQKLAAT